MTNWLRELFSTDKVLANANYFIVVTALGLFYLLLANWIEYLIMLFFSLRFLKLRRKWFFCYHLHLTSSLYDSVPGLKAALSERLSYKDGVLGYPQFTSPKDPKNTGIKNFSDICEETRRQGFFFLSTRSAILLFIRDNEQTQNLLKGEKPSKAMWSKYNELLSDEYWALSWFFSGQRQLRIIVCSSREHFTGTLCFYHSSKQVNSPCTLDSDVKNAEDVNFCVIRSKEENIYFDDDNALDPTIDENNTKFCYLVALRKSGIGYRRCLAIAIQLFGVTEYNAMVLSGMRFSCFVRILSHLSTRFDRSYFIEGYCSNDITFMLVGVLRDVEGIMCSSTNVKLVIAAKLCAVAATVYAASLSGVVLTDDLKQRRDEAVQSIMAMSILKKDLEAKQPLCSKAEARDALIAAWGAVRHLSEQRQSLNPDMMKQALLAATVAAVSAVMSCPFKPHDAPVGDEINPIRACVRHLYHWEKTRAVRCLNNDGLASIASSLFPSSSTSPCTSVAAVFGPLARYFDRLLVSAAIDVLRRCLNVSLTSTMRSLFRRSYTSPRPRRVPPVGDTRVESPLVRFLEVLHGLLEVPILRRCISKTKTMLLPTSGKDTTLSKLLKAQDSTCIRVGYGSEGVFFNVKYGQFWGRGVLSHSLKKQENPKVLTGSIPGDVVLGGYFHRMATTEPNLNAVAAV